MVLGWDGGSRVGGEVGWSGEVGRWWGGSKMVERRVFGCIYFFSYIYITKELDQSTQPYLHTSPNPP
jgi:hypothetical protein